MSDTPTHDLAADCIVAVIQAVRNGKDAQAIVEPMIATALRDVERAAYERAAGVADGFKGEPVQIKHEQDWAHHGERMSAIRIANRIRALASEKQP